MPPATVPLSPEFEKAIADSKKLTSKPSNEDMLELYGLYKVGTGEKFADATPPGMFELKNKAKYNAWDAVHKEGISVETAQSRYVAKVEEMKVTYGYDENKVPETVGA
ncbi:acyl-CoA-binding protein [Ceratocystis lukuohia]|uniref:ACB domain-containing protein n=2 Tax=Ceratocystis TaxID=5157 RepID=A0A0F8D031_CERFI|nr:hypothetical protein CFO_g1449 [Ceratocystis platani]